MDKYLKETTMLDHNSIIIQKLIKNKGWLSLDEYERIKEIYNFVRDEILLDTTLMMDSLPLKF